MIPDEPAKTVERIGIKQKPLPKQGSGYLEDLTQDYDSNMKFDSPQLTKFMRKSRYSAMGSQSNLRDQQVKSGVLNKYTLEKSSYVMS